MGLSNHDHLLRGDSDTTHKNSPKLKSKITNLDLSKKHSNNMYDSLPTSFGRKGGYGDRRGGGGGGRGGGRGGGFKKEYSGPGASLRKPRWDMNSLPRFEKNFYREHPNVQARSNAEVGAFRNSKEIAISG